MADTGDFEGTPVDEAGDVSMTADTPVVEIGGSASAAAAAAATEEGTDADDTALPFQEEAMEDVPPRVTYIDYLKSPVIGLLVGQGDEQALLTAHQALLTTSPWFKDACDKFSSDLSVSRYYKSSLFT
jgi:hypothetical protein